MQGKMHRIRSLTPAAGLALAMHVHHADQKAVEMNMDSVTGFSRSLPAADSYGGGQAKDEGEKPNRVLSY
jgi:hypothetical protein